VPAYAEEDEAECWAVIVGVSEYEHYHGEQAYFANNAREFASQLSSLWGDDHVKLLTDSMATEEAIEDAITDWLVSRADTNDVALFYFSGMAEGDDVAFAPYDARYSETWTNDRELDKWLGMLDSEKIVVILEIAHAGRFETKLSDSGRVVLMACRSDESHWYNTALQQSIFSYLVLEALRGFEAADTNNDMELSAEEIFNYAQSGTEDLVEDEQHPQMSDYYEGQLSLLIKVTAGVESDMAQDVNILSIAGRTYSAGDLPISFIWTPDSSHDFEVVSSVSGGSGIEYAFNSWDDGTKSASRTISHGGAYIANYTTHYYLTVESAYGDPQGEGWYDSGSRATISVTSPQGKIIRQVFTGWSGDFSATTPSASVTMNGPKTITANWRTDYMQLYMIIGGVLVLLGGIAAGVTIMLVRRRR